MTASRQISVGRLRIAPEAGVVIVATLVFIGISVWWLLYDQRLPGAGDPGRHISTTLGYAGLLADWDLSGLVTYHGDGGFFYPPVVRVIGAVPAALGLSVEDWGTIAVNLVFVPLLAAGCYLTGRLVYGPLAGTLAAVFALGTPMVLSLFHVFLLDAPLAAVTAISVWALLATDRFGDRRRSVLAGALAGVGLMVKTAAPIFLVGPLVVMLIGGGWRHWRNLVLAGAVALVVAAPWHLFHLDDVTNLSGQAPTGVASGIGGGPGVTEDLLDKLAVYGWTAINLQYFVPLLALFAIGTMAAVREFRTRRHLPELFAGLLVAYLVFAIAISFRDPRYTLPLVVFVAVLATGWIAHTRRSALRGAAIGVLVAAVALNVIGSTTDALPTAKVHAPGDDPNPGDPNQPGVFTFFDDAGYVAGVPRPDRFWDRLLSAAEADGVETARIFVRERPSQGIDDLAFDVAAEQREIRTASFSETPPTDPDLIVNAWWFTPDSYWIEEEGLPPPCATVPDGTSAPEGSGPVGLKVSVERRVGNRYERWCDF